MPKFVGLALNDHGVGSVEFHEDDEQLVDTLLGGLGLDASAPMRRNFGRSNTMVSQVSALQGAESEGMLERVNDAFQNAGFEIGVM